MKKSLIFAFTLTAFAATASFAQSTTSSTSGTQQQQSTQGGRAQDNSGNKQPNPTQPANTGGTSTGSSNATSTNTGTESSTNASTSDSKAGGANAGTGSGGNVGAGGSGAAAGAGGSTTNTGGAKTTPGHTGSQEARETDEESGSTRPGGADGKNANDVGRYSESNDNNKSMLNSEEAVAKRRKNMTEADTTLKKGSGAGKRNMKDRAGQTGNYGNQEIKHNQKTQPRP